MFHCFTKDHEPYRLPVTPSRTRQRVGTFAPAMLKSTPFHARTAPLVRAQTWRRWAGYQVASAYEPHPDREYAAIRNAAALFDVSPLHKYLITGPRRRASCSTAWSRATSPSAPSARCSTRRGATRTAR